LVLTKENYEEALKENQFLLVEFYAPWCGHCKALAPEYSAAALALAEKSSPIKLAKVDATEESTLAEENQVRGYPTLKFYRNGNAIDYSGGRTKDEIIAWLEKKTGPAAGEIKGMEELEEFKGKGDVAVVGVFDDSSSTAYKAFMEVADSLDDVPFAVVVDKELKKTLEVEKEAVLVFRKFDTPLVTLTTDLTKSSITTFIKQEQLPLIIDFNHDTAQKIFGGDIKSHVLLFLPKSDYAKSQKFLSLAKKYRSRLLFVTINVDLEDHQRIIEFFGMKKDEIPSVRLIRLQDEMQKFKPEENVLEDESKMETFIEDFFGGKLRQHLLSQDLPEDWDKEDVKTLVASNFDEVVMEEGKTVLVEFYAPWCGHCKQLAPTYEKLAAHFAKEDASVVIAKIDSTINELEHTKINSFPTIKLYKKDNSVVDYNGERTLDGLMKFVESEGKEGGSEEGGEVEDEGNVKDEL